MFAGASLLVLAAGCQPTLPPVLADGAPGANAYEVVVVDAEHADAVESGLDRSDIVTRFDDDGWRRARDASGRGRRDEELRLGSTRARHADDSPAPSYPLEQGFQVQLDVVVRGGNPTDRETQAVLYELHRTSGYQRTWRAN